MTNSVGGIYTAISVRKEPLEINQDHEIHNSLRHLGYLFAT
jgi:hypothetical protein